MLLRKEKTHHLVRCNIFLRKKDLSLIKGILLTLPAYFVLFCNATIGQEHFIEASRLYVARWEENWKAHILIDSVFSAKENMDWGLGVYLFYIRPLQAKGFGSLQLIEVMEEYLQRGKFGKEGMVSAWGWAGNLGMWKATSRGWNDFSVR